MTQICILSPDPDHAEYAPMWPIQERLLTEALALADIVPDYRPWTGDDDLSSYDLVLPLLAWGYHDAPILWRERIAAWESAHVRLANPAAVLRWNCEKTYLVDFQDRMPGILPSVFSNAASTALLDEARARFGDIPLIAKPTISAGAHGVTPLQPGEPLPETALGHPTLIQPMLPAIATEGEYSLLYFGGQLSHAILKIPKTGDFRVQSQHGGREIPVSPPAAAVKTAETVLASLTDPLLYARVDLVADGTGNYVLMELELIEPQLFLEHAPDGGRAFALAVKTFASSPAIMTEPPIRRTLE